MIERAKPRATTLTRAAPRPAAPPAPKQLVAPFPYFGGKRSVVADVWKRFGSPAIYLEPFCGSAAMLLGSPTIATTETINDLNCFVANFWRSVKHNADAVVTWADYPISHIDLGARNAWLRDQADRIGASLQDPNWGGDAQVAGWWVWGMGAYIGTGWCDYKAVAEKAPIPRHGRGSVPSTASPTGVHSVGVYDQTSRHAVGKIPAVGGSGAGVHALPSAETGGAPAHLLTSAGRNAWATIMVLVNRLERVNLIHADWTRSLHLPKGHKSIAIFFDPPYKKYEKFYASIRPVAADVEDWCREHADLRIALCGHVDDYDLPGWDVMPWKRMGATYGGTGTQDAECIWFSPACLPVANETLFG